MVKEDFCTKQHNDIVRAQTCTAPKNLMSLMCHSKSNPTNKVTNDRMHSLSNKSMFYYTEALF